MSVRWPVLLALAVLLLACAPLPERIPADAGLLAAQVARERELGRLQHWALSGRIALAGPGGGGNGRIEWRQDGDDFQIELSAPVSRQSWRLTGTAGWYVLEGLEGGPWEGADPEALVWNATGWRVPVESLSRWVLGARGAAPAALEFTLDGLPAELRQAGWTVSYRAWRREPEPPLPVRVFASRGEDRVRLQIDHWHLGSASRRGPAVDGD